MVKLLHVRKRQQDICFRFRRLLPYQRLKPSLKYTTQGKRKRQLSSSYRWNSLTNVPRGCTGCR